jgi:hypothetical protein
MRKVALFTLCTLFTLLLADSSRAETFYVDWTHGSDSDDRDGSNDTLQSWKTLSYACGRVSGPDTIHINPGLHYVDDARCNLASGVTIRGAGADSTKITVKFAGAGDTSYIHRVRPGQAIYPGNNDISGFTIDGDHKTLGTGIRLRGCDNITIHDMKFQHIKSHAIALSGYNGWGSFKETMKAPPPRYGHNCVIHDVVIGDCTTQTTAEHDDRYGAIDLEGLADSQFYNLTINENYPQHGTGIKAVPGWLSNVKFYRNTIYNYETDTDCFNMEVYNLIDNSEIYDSNFHHLISLNGGPVQAAGTWNLKIHNNDFKLLTGDVTGNEFSHNNVDIYQNYFHDGNTPAAGIWATNGMTGSSVRNWRFHHNVVYNASNGIYFGRQSSANGNNNIGIYNNVFDSMTGHFWGGYGINGEALEGSCQGVTIKNNIFSNCSAGPAHLERLTEVVFDSNLFYGANHDIIGAVAGRHNRVAVPGFAGSTNPKLPRPLPFYALTGPVSNLHDSGTNVGLPFKGAAPDIGCCEYGASGTIGSSASSPATPGKAPKRKGPRALHH